MSIKRRTRGREGRNTAPKPGVYHRRKKRYTKKTRLNEHSVVKKEMFRTGTGGEEGKQVGRSQGAGRILQSKSKGRPA